MKDLGDNVKGCKPKKPNPKKRTRFDVADKDVERASWEGIPEKEFSGTDEAAKTAITPAATVGAVPGKPARGTGGRNDGRAGSAYQMSGGMPSPDFYGQAQCLQSVPAHQGSRERLADHLASSEVAIVFEDLIHTHKTVLRGMGTDLVSHTQHTLQTHSSRSDKLLRCRGGGQREQCQLEIKVVTMWNDEDNNPYGTFDRRGSLSPDLHPSNYQQSDNERPTTPTSGTSSPTNDPPELISRPRDLSDDEEDNYAQQRSEHLPRKKGGYDSRIEQILYEHPELQIVITDAGKSNESGASYIAYTIRTGDLEVRRRYSEFNSLRATLVNLHPTLIIPPIPEKHSMADYAAKPTKAKEDVGIIDLRKRMLTMFLNRCRKMREVREDGVWWRFLDPNASWSEVLHSHPVASIPKSIMRAPPLDPSNPTPAHQWLPVPSTSAKLRSVSRTSSTGTPVSPPHQSYMASTAAHTIPSSQFYGRFPPSSQNLSEQELDPYFNNFETNTRDLELLLQGSIEKVNRRTLTHLSALSTDMAELGARYNGFSLSEQSATVAAAIEKIGQAVDSSYIATEELSSSLGANFAEPMRESAQFAGVVRSVLRYRIMKRIQEEMTKDELYAKKTLLESLERSEMEAKRIEQYLSGSTSPSATPKRSISSASARSTKSDTAPTTRPEGSNEDADSVDSDFPPAHAHRPASPPSSSHGPQGQEPDSPTRNHRKTQSGGFVANKIFGRISHAIHGVVDVDPERTRRDTIGKTRESLIHLEQALEVSEKDVKDASAGILKDLKRFQLEKEDDLKRYMMAYAKCHIHWAKRNMETWKEAKEEVDKIDVR
ncbi:MAG: hypothetical protein Q9173_001017 [Seirophora scorigena]